MSQLEKWDKQLQPYKALTYKTSRTKKNFFSMILMNDTIKKKEQPRILFQYSLGRYGLSSRERTSTSALKKILLISVEFAARYKKKTGLSLIKIESLNMPSSIKPALLRLKKDEFNILWVSHNTTQPFNGCRLGKSR